MAGSWPAYNGDRVKLWRLVDAIPDLIREESGLSNCAFSPDSRLFAIGDADGSIGLFDLPSGKSLRRLAAGGAPRFLAFNPRGEQLAVASPTCVQIRDLETGKTCAEFHIWDAATGRLVKDLVPNQPFVPVGFSPDGKWLATSGDVCRLWAVDS